MNALGRSRFRPAESWDDAVGRTPGYEALASRPKGRPWERHTTYLTPSEMQIVAAIGSVTPCLREHESLRVLDFGGGYGHYFGLASAVFPTWGWKWTVCETSAVVDQALGLGAPPALRWTTQDDASGEFEIALASASLHYVRDPAAALEWLLHKSRFVIINRTPLWPIAEDAVSCQAVDGQAAYPAWFLSRAVFERNVSALGQILITWSNTEDRAFFAGHRGVYSGAVITSDA